MRDVLQSKVMLKFVIVSIIFGLFVLSVAGNVRATTYYVDSSNGNDAWGGRANAPGAADGPWQSLARVRSATFAPGDFVLLKCGQTWREPLAVSNSGSAQSPITIGSYPAGCATPPVIDGSVNIPADNWTLYSGRIYRARLPIQLIGNGSLPRQLIVENRQMTPARHPNRGFDPSRPLSPYLLNAQDSDQTLVGGTYKSTYLTTGSDLLLPAGATIRPGTSVRIRTNAWTIDERIVSSVNGTRVSFSTPTAFPLKAGWGYLLMGDLWMLDQAGEWYFDPTTRYLYIWMPDGAIPGSRVAVAQIDVGIDLGNRSYIVVDGVAVRRTRVGIRARDSSYVVIRNSSITDTVDEGADVAGSTNSSLTDNSFTRTGRDAVAGLDVVTGRTATGLQVVGNRIVDSAVRLEGGQLVSLPVHSFGAIFAANDAYVSGNSIINAAYNGILPGPNARIENNYIENVCTVLDDGGAIYLGGENNNSLISKNVIYHVPGAPEGKPTHDSRGQGIYIDELGSGITVSGNTIIDAEYGLHLHNAANNVVQNNKLYGNRRYQIWLEEDSRRVNPAGDVFGNRITGNTMVPNTPAPSVYQRTNLVDERTNSASTEQFATYDGNIYSALLSPVVAVEETSNGGYYRNLQQWQTATTSAGTPRALDIQGSQITTGNSASYRVSGTNFLPNGNMSNGLAGWSAWNEVSPLGVRTSEACTVGQCMKYAAGASAGLIVSPNFSVAKDQWYRIAFDMKASSEGQPIFFGVQRGGGGTNGNEWLMSYSSIGTSQGWKRYSLVFQSTKTVTALDPLTLDWGARLVFTGIGSGQSLWLGNVEIVPVARVGFPLRTNILVNSSHKTAAVDCPDAGADGMAYCGRYVRFADGTPVSFPYRLEPLGTEMVYSRGDTLSDTDGDGIGDVQDACPNSPPASGIDSRGCAIGQVAQ